MASKRGTARAFASPQTSVARSPILRHSIRQTVARFWQNPVARQADRGNRRRRRQGNHISEANLFLHGSTVAINTMLERTKERRC